jgi:ADP-heptose:LPS heptosyltransferase
MHISRDHSQKATFLTEKFLGKCKRVLYMSPMAIGDYVYQGAFLKALSNKYPRLEIDLWIDDCRASKKLWHTGRNTVMRQWLSSESYINYVYSMPETMEDRDQKIKEAWSKDYDAVVFITTSRISKFARTALGIVNRGKVFGTISSNVIDNILNYSTYKKLDGKISIQNTFKYDHITDFYQTIFQRFFSLQVPNEKRILKLNLAADLIENCAIKLSYFARRHQLQNPKTIFINHLSTTSKRDWQLDQVEELTLLINEAIPNNLVILNAPPHAYEDLCKWLKNNQKLNSLAIEVFTAKENFFSLPALMSQCDLVISVETAIMHLASSLNLRQIALLRKSAYRWRPQNNAKVILGKKRVDSISPATVLKSMPTL